MPFRRALLIHYVSLVKSLCDRVPSISRNKFTADLVWNLAGFFFIGISGLLLTLIVVRAYGVAALGDFTLVYALYIILSQVATGGIHLSVLKYSAEFSANFAKRSQILIAGLISAFIVSVAVSITIWLLRDSFVLVYDNRAVGEGLVWTLPALIWFSLNKTLLAFLNGLRMMKAFAIFQTLRSGLLILSLLILVVVPFDSAQLTVIFSISEGALFLVLFPFCLGYVQKSHLQNLQHWMRIHTVFGVKALPGNLLIEANSRIDIVVLGMFVSSSLVGIYGYAAMAVEGFIQLMVVVRANVNPLLTQIYVSEGAEALGTLIRRGRPLAYQFLGSLGLVAILAFPVIVYLGLGDNVWEIELIFAILMSGIIVSAGYMPFLAVFNQVGQPVVQTILLTFVFVTNLALNLVLCFAFGIWGAAVATTTSFLIQVVYLKLLCRRSLAVII